MLASQVRIPPGEIANVAGHLGGGVYSGTAVGGGAIATFFVTTGTGFIVLITSFAWIFAANCRLRWVETWDTSGLYCNYR